MLNRDNLISWYQRLELSRQAQSLIDQVRSSAPTRRVGGGHGNVTGRYPSRKMGLTIQFESHRVELVYYIIYAEVLNGRSFCRLSTIAPRHWQARAIDLLHGETRVVGVGVSEP